MEQVKPGNYVVYKGKDFIAHASPSFNMTWKGVTYIVEWHPYFGPSRLKKNGDLYSRQPGEKHPFWDAIASWQNNNLEVDSDGNAVL